MRTSLSSKGPPMRSSTILFLVIALTSCSSSPDSPEPTTRPADATTSVSSTHSAATPDSPDSRPNVQRLEFETTIAAPVDRVWKVMLSADGYQKWTAPFMVGSYFEGSWEEGERIHFLAPGGDGMIAEIATHRRHEVVSIKHVGYLVDGVEDTTSEEVRAWAPAYETYHFEKVPGGTRVRIEQDAQTGYEEYMNDVWPKALAALKALCEER